MKAAVTFSESMATHGLHCSDPLIADGKIHRFNVNGDKPGSHNGWYVLFGNGAGAYGSWKTGETFTFCAKNEKSLSDAERAKLRKQIAEAEKARDEEQRRLHAEARKKTAWIWEHSKLVEKHPYLAAKGLNVVSYSLRTDDQKRLVIPIVDTAGTVHSLQFIDPKGNKKFLPDGAITGHFSTIDGTGDTFIDGTGDTLLICEGFSTGLSLHEAMGYPVACALTCGNLLPVCEGLHKKSPNVKLVVCADDDYQTSGNPGLTKAREAAEVVGAALVVPKFKDQAHRGTDFNDLHQMEDLEAVWLQIKEALNSPDKRASLSFTPEGPPDEGCELYGGCSDTDEAVEGIPQKKKSLEDIVITLGALCEIGVEKKKEYLAPWLTESSLTLIAGRRGVGKTWLALSLLDAVTQGKDFGPWKGGESAPCLFLDGESAIQDIIGRKKSLDLSSDLLIYSDAHANRCGLPKADLTDTAWRITVKNILIAKNIKLWAVDNLATLASGLDENAKQDWDPINQWLLELRFAGIATIMLHHLGKGGSQRGTSAREDNLDTSLMLKAPHDYTPEDGARFVVNFSKARVPLEYLPQIADTEFKLIKNANGNYLWTHSGVKRKIKNEILRLFDEGLSQGNIKDTLNINKAYVSRIRKQAIQNGLLTPKNKLTQTGIMGINE